MKKIGIIGAMELEVETLKAKMEVKQTTKKAGMEFFEGTLNGVDAVIVRSGIGKVNAGICTQILVDLFAVTHIINTGVAGSLDALKWPEILGCIAGDDTIMCAAKTADMALGAAEKLRSFVRLNK